MSKKARLEIDTDETAVVTVHGDPTQLRQIVMNLVANASEALGADPGTVRIATRVVAAMPPVSRVSIPTGTWLPGTTCSSRSPTPGAGWTSRPGFACSIRSSPPSSWAGGLGLAVVLGIVRAHRGGLSVDSTPGEGTRFRVLLPAAGRPAEAEGTPPGSAGSRTGVRHRALVDDEDAVRELCRAVLERGGFSVIEARMVARRWTASANGKPRCCWCCWT